jgi:hypothetical protein
MTFTLDIFKQDSETVRAKFDAAFEPEMSAVCAAIDGAVSAEVAVDALLPSTIPEGPRKQHAHCLALIRKVVNDILAAMDALRSGYLDLSHAATRSAMEGFSTAIILNSDPQVLQPYLEQRFSVNKSVDIVVRRHTEFGLGETEAKSMKTAYENKHRMAHPTVLAVAAHFPLDGQQFPLGGSFDSGKLTYYRSHLNDLVTLARSIEGFLKYRFPDQLRLSVQKVQGSAGS